MVVDADGLNVYEAQGKDLATIKTPLILTPHTGELKKLMNHDIPEDPLKRIHTTRDLANSTGAVLLHKGAPSLVAAPKGDVWVNSAGSSALATAGSGDVLTGVITALVCQALAPFEAAQLGVYVHGLAGDLAAQELGQTALIASDLIRFLASAFRRLERPT